MSPLLLEAGIVLATLVFGVGAIQLGSIPSARHDRRAGWMLVGFAFVLLGAHEAALLVLPLWIGAETESAGFLASATSWLGAGRALLLLGFALSLLFATVHRSWTGAVKPIQLWLPLLLWPFSGLLLEPISRSLTGRDLLVILIRAATIVALLSALWLSAVRESMDLQLWLALTTYTVLGSVIFSLSATYHSMGLSAPGMLTDSVLRWLVLFSLLVMTALLLWRFQIFRRGLASGSLLELEWHWPAWGRGKKPNSDTEIQRSS